MSQETRLTHAALVLLQASEKAFENNNRKRGISLIKDCLELLGNGYERLLEELEIEVQTEQPAEHIAEISKSGINIVDKPESKDDAGVVSEPAEQEIKDGAGVVSKSEKSQTRDGSGIS